MRSGDEGLTVALSLRWARLWILSQPVHSPLESGNHPSIGGLCGPSLRSALVDLTHVVRAVRIDEFPVAYWTMQNREECDYLFVPMESAGNVVKRLERG